MPASGPYEIATTFLHFRDDGAIDPIFSGPAFWESLGKGELPHLDQGRLMSSFSFDEDWNSWECHPHGDERVCLLSGSVDVVLQRDDHEDVIALQEAGAFALVPRGTWHTARTGTPSTLLFITRGEGTLHKPL